MPKDPLHCFERLTVTDLRVEPERVRATYQVDGRGRPERFELRLAWESPVFRPALAASRNLAALIAVQPALNYGLFGEEIRLDLPLDAADLGFLRRMLENTSREIYVNRIHAPNPFLRPAIARLPFTRRRIYTRAHLTARRERRIPWERALDPGRAVVLSSGGKESLLGFGLLRELGVAVHPVFYNESGKHWFTALNAYRRFAAEVPGTARVWGNTDRLFAWMNRRLPILRRDWAAVHADDYPLRLWTVAILVFAAIPVLLERGASRLVVGDEFDTTRIVTTHGVRHHDGLYDQSRFFDDALTRFLGAKGIAYQQFSLLRPLSELLVEKTLAERYPDLLELQVSCHAAHMDKGVVRPCGTCEKCRRVVAMLTALGVDPARLGYAPEAAKRLVAYLRRHPLHQEAELNQHLLALLAARGHAVGGPGAAVAARLHPEVEMLRFDPMRSPREAIPADLRGPVYDLLAKHARGALERRGRTWVPVKPS